MVEHVRCVDMAWRGADLGTRRIQFVPTHYWNQDGSGGVRNYCYNDGSGSCNKFSQASIKRFEDGLALCFGAALDAGFSTIAITPHVDCGDDGEWHVSKWRNGLEFNPRQKYDGYSYEEIMLQPLARALARYESDSRLKRIHFALQGEMGATVMRYPAQYLNLLPDIANIFSSGAARSSPSSTQTAKNAGRGGGGLDRIMVQQQAAPEARSFDNTTHTSSQPSTKNAATAGASVTLPSAPPVAPGATALAAGHTSHSIQQPAQNQLQSASSARKTPNGVRLEFGLTFNFDTSHGLQGNTASLRSRANQEVEKLIRAMDFIGISAYAPQNPDFKPEMLQAAAYTMMDSFSSVGVDARKAIQQGGAALQYVEYGLGGGVSQSGVGIAPNPAAAMRQPFMGVMGAYSKDIDPWQREALRTFMHTFWRRTLTWLAQGGGPTFKIEACYVWGKASWDVLGIYPESTSGSGSFRDDTVVGMVRAHNKAISKQR
ncbi:uncharacterized protein HaLaN_07588 [Haematococcus lacustris]|uniref:Uncharacterized protein n=1 Tax=Haematococcus lacustris TaxID=44745 RepID=A0A699YQU7_HAELA|nr:uncharacterized protein HaLaN_07588 [Haematococcus lacustris]